MADQESSLDTVRREAELREAEAFGFYQKTAEHAQDPGVRELLRDLGRTEQTHEEIAANLESTILTASARAKEVKTSEHLFLLHMCSWDSSG